VTLEKPDLAHTRAEARARFLRRLVLAELLARRGEGPLAPRFGLKPLCPVRDRGAEPKP
jgi:hypothetical protein